MPKNLLYLAVLTASLLSSCASRGMPRGAVDDEVAGNAEEIYVFRTIRTRHERGATPACAAAQFPSANEDYYELWSIALRSQDSRVVNAREKLVGGFTACLGRLAVGHSVPMYATGNLAHTHWTGTGECIPLKSQPPIRTAVAFTCRLDLGGLPTGYVGGSLVSSTLAPLLGGSQPANAHVPGYLSTSVVTVRLWRETEAGRR